ncbi:MAG: right-handed parallel beta-helix repeat-containing protein [Methanobrevibacter sp.]|uniref:right-handed parallel beta-helix repeat-containing protein n=1 Tax=Methanobrevibacter sp. TaxID=66852 RepID=UPI0025E662B6|nr:right-handed parallel beta-helix repeat-containing protein [Methanobrevibacter sp.]MBQ6098656.1 right-handed parallel beta-helix repeat-containing protein [Methanobrevibacter sp.]
MNKKILLSFLLVVLIALTVGSVAAADADVDDVIAAEPAPTVQNIQPVNNTVADVQSAISSANAGDTVDLSNFENYDFAGSGVTIETGITLKGNGNTTIAGFGNGNGLVLVKASNVTIQGLKFIDNNPANKFVYNGTVKGVGVAFNGVTSGLLTNCSFVDFNNAVRGIGATNVVIENNEFTGGYSTWIVNDPTVNEETGSKVLNIYRQSSNFTIRNNEFIGQVLDAISIAQGSGYNVVENNRFINNTYSIYFGGSSTKNSVIRNNTFINCGQFTEGNVSWDKLPVISIQKASNDIAIEDNTFKAVENSVLIAAEESNEAHGFPSSLGNINVTGNTVELYNDSVNAKSVVLFHVLCRNGTTLNLFAPLKVSNNKLADGVREYVVWYTAWGEEVTVLNNTASDLQKVIDAANPGAVIDVSYVSDFDFGTSGVTISKDNITLKGNNTRIVGTGDGSGLVLVKGSNVTIQGFKFVDVNPNNVFVYNGTVKGVGVAFNGVTSGLLTDCSFEDFNNAVRGIGATNVVIENNEFTGGYSTWIVNDPTVNEETGSKVLNIYRASSNFTIRNNTFTGQVLDAISIAQGSGNNVVENNRFINNTYSIYFGGSSTKNSVIRNNTFINCGQFTEGDVVWKELPVISIQKASNDIAIKDNTFEAVSDSVLVAAEQGNEAHGFPSALGNINVTGNTVKSYDNKTDAKSVVLFSILCRNGGLNLSAPINVTGNKLEDGMKNVLLQTTGDTYLDNTVTVVRQATDIKSQDYTTYAIDYNAGERGGYFTATLVDGSGNALANKAVKIGFNGKVYNTTTDENGVAKLQINLANEGTYTFAVAFLGDDQYNASFIVQKIIVNKKTTSISAAAKSYKASAKTKSYTVTLKTIKGSSTDGKTYLKEGKTIKLTVNGKTYTAKTNAKGQATFKLDITKKGTYTANINFAGDKTYQASKASAKITIN